MANKDVERLATSGRTGLAQGPGGTGTRSVVIPPLPDLPPSLTPTDRAAYRERCRVWRDQFQAQFPIPG